MNKTEKLRGKHKSTEIQDIQPSTRPRINISQVPAGKSCISVVSVVSVFSRSVLCLCYVVVCVFSIVNAKA